MFAKCALLVVVVAACTHAHPATTPSARAVPGSAGQPGACADPARDGVTSAHPKLEHADRDLDGDGRPEAVIVDRARCSPDGNCYWNVFAQPRDATDCARYLGTFEGASLEALASKGDANMSDVRAAYRQAGGRVLLQSYRFVRGGYQITDVLQCKRAADDRLECADTER